MIERHIFVEALNKSDEAQRRAFIEAACCGNRELRARIERLLELHVQAEQQVQIPATAEAGRLPADEPPIIHVGDTGVTLASPVTALTAGTVVAGRYKLLQQIGTGGMGSVWMAEQIAPVKRLVAFKVIKEDLESRRVLARFEAERQALALMDHRHIARILDAGTTATGRPFFVMDLVKGVPITEFCDSHQSTIAQRLELFIEVCHAVQHAHQKGVIHRDLKPSNILVESHDGKSVPKIIDFGLAKALHQLPLADRTLFTGFGAVLGTPLYMAPEQAEFSAIDVDTRADIYALGVILYELLTGSTPLEKKRLAEAAWDEIRRVIKEEEPPRPSARLSTSEALASVAARRQTEPARLGKLVRGDLDWIVMKALAKERDRRYDTANAFADDVSDFLGDKPVSAGPPTIGYRLRKFAKRNRARVITASLLMAALLMGLAGTFVGMVRARQAESQAGAALERVTAEQGKTKNALADAERNRLDAENQRDEARGRLSRQFVEKAAALTDQGNALGGAPWLVDSLKLDENGPRSTNLQRLRLGAIMRPALSLINFWPDAACASLHPDGVRLALGQGRTVRLIRVGSDEPLVPSMIQRTDVSEILFLPNSERSIVICGLRSTMGQPTTAQIWDMGSGQPLTAEMPIGNLEKGANEVRLSLDGGHLVALWQGHLNRYNVNTEVYLYETTKLEPVGRPFVRGHGEDFDRVALDLRHLEALTLTRDTPSGLDFKSEAQVWDIPTGDPLFEPVAAGEWIADGKFDPEAKRFALALHNTSRIYDAASGKPLTPPIPLPAGPMAEAMSRLMGMINLRPSTPQSNGPLKVAFSPDGNLLATLGEGFIRVWDAGKGTEKRHIPNVGLGIYQLAFSPDGTSIYTLGSSGFAAWDAATGDQQLAVADDGRDGVRYVEFNSDGLQLATVGFAGVRMWQRNGGPSTSFLPHGGLVRALFSKDGRFLLTIGNGVRVWDLAGATPSLGPFTVPQNGRMRSVAIGPVDGPIACLGDDGRIEARDSQTGETLAMLPHVAGEWVSASVSPDGRYFVTLGWPTGQSTIPDDEETAGRMCSVGSGGYLWQEARILQLWEASTGRAIAKPLHHRVVDRVLFHPDGNTLLVAGSYYDYSHLDEGQLRNGKVISEIHAWDMPTGKPRSSVRRLPSHVELVAISADGKRLLVITPRLGKNA